MKKSFAFKNRIISGLFTLTCISLIHNPIHSMQTATSIAKTGFSGLCSATELLITLLPLADSVFNPHDLYAEKLKNISSDTPEPITQFVTQLAEKRNIDNVKVCLDKTGYSYRTEENGKIIYIPVSHTQELESLLSKKNLDTDDTKKLNEHCGTIHHELTHITMRSGKNAHTYEPIIGCFGALVISAGLTHTIKNYIPYIDNNMMLSNTFKLIRGIVTLYTALKIKNMNIYKKYDEIKADDGIPNQKEILEAMAQYFETGHTSRMTSVNYIKNNIPWKQILFEPMSPEDTLNRAQCVAMKLIPTCCFEYPLITELIFHTQEEHPSDLRRANRFKGRIAQLENMTVHKK